ncbi:uncharacterized protein HD556DRAFT_376205 [Suillus plorans]|uniref:Secreted protein n=1 Tax=Suillus plorans TaxID=116603 RepID=A0A9P7DIG2_9AGAM|nr:uncharacterized protein HD556DRAFT_376205 [Suillus plorans]KAG1795812.1 hypothetical protein HD556DRAFT_376205 [Suillus plorans]
MFLTLILLGFLLNFLVLHKATLLDIDRTFGSLSSTSNLPSVTAIIAPQGVRNFCSSVEADRTQHPESRLLGLCCLAHPSTNTT